jgi:hypothetical protein
MNSDEVEHLQELLKIHKRRVNVLEQQAAKYGINCPPEIKVEIEDIQQQIARFERQLQGNVISSYIQGRETLRQFTRDMDTVTQGLSNVVVEEKRTYRLFGLAVWSVVISRTILTLLMLAAVIGVGLALQPHITGLTISSTAQAQTAQAQSQTVKAFLATRSAAQVQTRVAAQTALAQTLTAGQVTIAAEQTRTAIVNAQTVAAQRTADAATADALSATPTPTMTTTPLIETPPVPLTETPPAPPPDTPTP